jgi:mono/diheme cytochrome c family protein
MRFTTLALISVLTASGPAPAGEAAAEVRAVFSTKCAGCHGPALSRPKGRFGYVLDLARVAGNRELVVPGAPHESELWELVRRGDMPPDDSPAGPLTPNEKETIRAWIAVGAPAADASPATTREETFPAEAPKLWPTLRRLGRLHLVLIHFPIALLLAAATGEVWSACGTRSRNASRRTPAREVHFCVVLGAAGAVASAALGWLYAGGGGGVEMSMALEPHRWLGTATACWATFTAVLSFREDRRGVRSGSFRLALLVAAALVSTTGHFGGILVHGNDFFTPG